MRLPGAALAVTLSLFLVGCSAQADPATPTNAGPADSVAASGSAPGISADSDGDAAQPESGSATTTTLSVASEREAATASTTTTAPSTTTTMTTGGGPATAGPAPQAALTLLNQGSSGEQVSALQRRLLALGYDVDVDGDYCPGTIAVVRAFETDHGSGVDGIWSGEDERQLTASFALVAPKMPASVTITIDAQRMDIFNAAGERISSAPVSTGAPGNDTPRGSFNVFARQRVGTAKNENVHMDYFVVFNGDVGMHGIPWVDSRDNRLWTPLGEEPVSHGCVRVDDSVVQWLYTFLPDGAPVYV